MNDSVESFVRKLHDEGIRAGREEAGHIVEAAHAEARQIVEAAHRRAEEIAREARAESARIEEQRSREMTLAARDIVLALQTAVEDVIADIIAKQAARPLSEPDFIVEALQGIVREYAATDARRVGHIEVNVREEVADRVSKDVSRLLAGALVGNGAATLEVRATLEKYGFEYKVDEGTVEVSARSMAELLAGHVSRELRPVFTQIQDRFQPLTRGERHAAIRV